MEENKSVIYLYNEKEIRVGEESFVDSFFDDRALGVVFEDDGNTGYFYAVDKEKGILDALHIYNVKDVIDKHLPSTIKILWNEDFTRSYLSINNYYHAIFDFKKHGGYCRSGFPKLHGDWVQDKNRILTDDLLF